jgi:hypothetical protein
VCKRDAREIFKPVVIIIITLSIYAINVIIIMVFLRIKITPPRPMLRPSSAMP